MNNIVVPEVLEISVVNSDISLFSEVESSFLIRFFAFISSKVLLLDPKLALLSFVHLLQIREYVGGLKSLYNHHQYN